MKNKVRELWAEDKAVVNGWLSIPSTVTAEINARAGFDSLTVDLQHGLNDYQSALSLLQAISIGDSTPLARVPWLEPGIVGKLLDAGAVGLICPMINTPEEAEALYRLFVDRALQFVAVQTGRFGMDMKVSLVNDGPVSYTHLTLPTILLV